MQKALFLFSLLLASVGTHAQQYSIFGNIKNAEGKAIESATVSLLKASDSSWVRSEITNDKGGYTFTAIAGGTYIIDVFAQGYKTTKQSLTVSGNIESLSIAVQKNNTQLNEVTVTDKKPFIEQGLGKTIINLSNSATTAGNTVLDLLRKSPGITVDMNGNITMQGKQGVLVLIDNKETYLSGQQLADYLRTLSAEQVAQLELITQPSARYDAEGNAGIINIKTKKNRKQGLNGVVNASYNQGTYPGTVNSINVEQTHSKLHVEGSYAFLHMTGFMDTKGWRNIKDESTGDVLYHFNEQGNLTETFEDHNLRFGADYKLSDKTTVDASIRGIYHTNHEYDAINSSFTDTGNNLTYSTATTQRGFIRRNVLANAGFRHDFNKDDNLTIMADYLQREENNFDDQVNSNYNAQMQPIPGGELFRDLHPTVTDAITAKADYTGQLKNKTKIETGAKSSYVTIHDNTAGEILQNNVYIPDTARSNNFTYRENINALYVTATKSFGKQWETQAGLRCENTHTSGTESTTGKSFDNNSTYLFPTLFVAYTPNTKNRFEFNYGRRISRPPYAWLNPFVRYYSQYYSETGNPTLQPQYSNNIELKHTYNNCFTTTCSYSHSEGLVGDVMHVNGNIEHKNLENIAVVNNLSIGLTYNAAIRKWWSLSAAGTYYETEFIGAQDGRHFNVSAPGWYFHVNNQLSFQHNWAAEASYYYAGDSIEGYMTYEDARQWLSLGVSKRMFRDTTLIKLSIEDPFNAYVYGYNNQWYNLDSHTENTWDNRHVNLSVTYNFGKGTKKQSNRDASEEQGRMGM